MFYRIVDLGPHYEACGRWQLENREMSGAGIPWETIGQFFTQDQAYVRADAHFDAYTRLQTPVVVTAWELT